VDMPPGTFDNDTIFCHFDKPSKVLFFLIYHFFDEFARFFRAADKCRSVPQPADDVRRKKDGAANRCVVLRTIRMVVVPLPA